MATCFCNRLVFCFDGYKTINGGVVMALEGWICPRCGKVNAPWVMQCSCNTNTQILPKVGAPYYEGDQATCNHMEDKQ